MIVKSLNDYIKVQSNQSFLRKCFVAFIMNDFSEIPNTSISLDKRNYKSIAGFGFLTKISENFNNEFETGINWILGREFSQSDNTLLDDIAIFGFLVGLKNIEKKETQRIWIQKLLNQKSKLNKPYQEIFSKFFQLFLNNRSEWLGTSELEIELSLFLKIHLNEKLDNSEAVSNYFIRTKRKSFPYYHIDDFFRNLIANSNIEHILKSFILDQGNFNSRVLKKEEDVYNKLKIILAENARKCAKIFIGLLAITILFIYAFGSIKVWTGDWNYLEPKTFIVFGTPILIYIINIFYFLFTDKELSFSPNKLSKKIEELRYNKLLHKFNIKEIDVQ